ncbi:MAG: DNA-binding FrmR family transcriptional regulator [Myxococcota bacterium]|jgi:DNA-binding FrmR family transcriptional regulator
MHLSEDDHKRLVARLKRAEGQLSGVRRMVQEDGNCVDVLLQLQAVRGALAKVGQLVLRNHVETCVTTSLRGDDDAQKDQQIDELMEVFARYAGVATR